MSMNYKALLQSDVTTTLEPLAVKLRLRQKELDTVRKRLADERENILKIESATAGLKAVASERLGGSFDDAAKWKTAMKKRTTDAETSRTIIATLVGEIIPQAQAAHLAAKELLERELSNAASRIAPVCEVEMGKWIGLAVDEREAFLDAVDAVAAELGTRLVGFLRITPDGCNYRPAPLDPPYLTEITLSESRFDASPGQFARRARGVLPTPPQEPRVAHQDAPGSMIDTPADQRTPWATIGPWRTGKRLLRTPPKRLEPLPRPMSQWYRDFTTLDATEIWTRSSRPRS